MPGIGKSQLALQYAALSHNRQQYSVVFWVSGATVEKLNQGLAKILTLVGHPDRDHPEQSTRLISARRWLEESDAHSSIKWLLVLDNINREVMAFLREHLPRKNSMGNILLTTRNPLPKLSPLWLGSGTTFSSFVLPVSKKLGLRQVIQLPLS
jgi:hypothetical protein